MPRPKSEKEQTSVKAHETVIAFLKAEAAKRGYTFNAFAEILLRHEAWRLLDNPNCEYRIPQISALQEALTKQPTKVSYFPESEPTSKVAEDE
tara:strand:- start:27 stop:305 length:279 start_codon:yes stop_codon:yes gene_type:complete